MKTSFGKLIGSSARMGPVEWTEKQPFIAPAHEKRALQSAAGKTRLDTEGRKDDGKLRPIGIPAFEDKIVQKAVAMLLEAIYEVDFRHCSYGFRRGRSAHDALAALRHNCFRAEVSTIIDADIQGYFDAIDHKQLVGFVKRRVNDGTLLRFIGKWLNAGVMEGDELKRSSVSI